MGPGLTAACALAVFLSLVLGTNHLIQPKAADVNRGRYTTMSNVPVMATSLSTMPPSSLAVKSPHTSLALKSTQTSLATKSPHTSLAVKSQHTSLSARSSTTSTTSLATKSQHTSLSVRGPINESCSTAPASQATSTSLSTTLASTSLSTIAPSPSATTEPKRRVLDEVVEELGNTIDRIERAMGLNLRRDAEAALKAIRTEETIIEVVNRAKAASDEAKEELQDRHQTARRNAQRQLASLKQGFESLVWGDEDVKGKGKEKDEAPEKKTKGKARSKETPRPGRGKWHTSKQKLCQRGKDNLKSSKPKDESKSKDNSQSKPKSKPKRKASFPTREEQEKAQTAGRAKRPTQSHPDEASMWVWDEYEYEYPFGYGPRAVMEEVREYFF